MKNFNKSIESGKTLDVILSKISATNILSVEDMICVRGGEGDGDDPIIIPPIPPSKQQ
ncbi:MAG TPA: hypothetical protein VK213_01700 [Bacteroidales bacterium]|nr:hypothetical protein [Bacteroidales bacterium]